MQLVCYILLQVCTKKLCDKQTEFKTDFLIMFLCAVNRISEFLRTEPVSVFHPKQMVHLKDLTHYLLFNKSICIP